MALPVFVEVVTDQRAARNEHVAIDDGAPDASVAADPDAGHQDALLDTAEAVDAHVGAQHAAGNRAARNDAARRDDRVERLTASLPELGEHELRRRRLRLVGS